MVDLSVDFCLLAVINHAAVSTGVQIPLRVPAFNSFGVEERMAVALLEQILMLCVSVLRDHHL